MWVSRAVVGLVVAVGVGMGAETAAAADCSLGQQRLQGRGSSFLNQAFNNTTSGWIVNAGCLVDGGGLISFLPADKDPQELSSDPVNTGFNSGNDLVFYDSQGGGNGMAAFGAGTGAGPKHSVTHGQRDPLVAFVGTGNGYDRGPGMPMTIAEEGAYVVPGATNEINDDDDGVLHTVPVAQGAIAVIVKEALGCKLPATRRYVFRMLVPSGPKGKTNSTIEKIFSGEDVSPGGSSPPYATWGDLGWKRTGTDLPCPVPIKRFVRRDNNSGTVFQFKQFLMANDEALTGTTPWGDHDSAAENNQIWPGRTIADAAIDNEGACDGVDSSIVGVAAEGDYVCASASSNGNSGLADTLNAQGANGGIGFADLSTARSKNFGWLNTADRTYWLPLFSPTSTSTVVDAAEAAQGFKQGGPKGANCLLADYGIGGTGALPTSTKQNWAQVLADQSVSGYPLCGLSFVAAWEDYNDPYPNTVVSCSVKQARQAGVRNLLQYVLGTTPGGDEGQTLLSANDYSALPGDVSLKAQTYFNQASFKKAPNVNVC